jgi:uncharacterized BrkB/YihY/UPF0761 family membrane protein
MQSIINGSFGCAVGLGLFLIGLPHAIVWGFLAAILRFIPYIGFTAATILPTTLSLAVFQGWLQPLLIIGLIMGLELVLNVGLEPFIEGLNRAYDVEEGRPFWKVRGIAILLTIGLSLFMIISIVLLAFGTQLGSWIADWVGSGGVFQVAWNILRWPVSSGLLIVAIALVYRTPWSRSIRWSATFSLPTPNPHSRRPCGSSRWRGARSSSWRVWRSPSPWRGGSGGAT